MSLDEVRGEMIEVNRQLQELLARLAAIRHEMGGTQRIARGVLDGSNHSAAIDGQGNLEFTFAALDDALGGIRTTIEFFADYIAFLSSQMGGRA